VHEPVGKHEAPRQERRAEEDEGPIDVLAQPRASLQTSEGAPQDDRGQRRRFQRTADAAEDRIDPPCRRKTLHEVLRPGGRKIRGEGRLAKSEEPDERGGQGGRSLEEPSRDPLEGRTGDERPRSDPQDDRAQPEDVREVDEQDQRGDPRRGSPPLRRPSLVRGDEIEEEQRAAGQEAHEPPVERRPEDQHRRHDRGVGRSSPPRGHCMEPRHDRQREDHHRDPAGRERSEDRLAHRDRTYTSA
jgi:hypothetical protein